MVVCAACHRSFETAPGDAIPYACVHCGSSIVGAYCDLELIGSGAMGNVYRARRPDMGGRVVAIKIPKVVSAQIHERFEREIAASARLQHENIVRALDRGQENGRPFLVMEHVRGRELADLIRAEHPLSVRRVARIMRDVAAGLRHAEQAGTVHRDIKPENILIAEDGSAKIMDYGLALIDDSPEAADRVTRHGVLLGTTGFMAPEQFGDPHSVTIRADVYALGCTVFYALTLRMPFQANGAMDICRQHAQSPRPDPRSRRADVPAALADLVRRAMAILPADRPAPVELVQALDELIPTLPRGAANGATARSATINVTCPYCDEPYVLRTDAIGKSILCTGRLCGRRFTVEAPADFPADEPVEDAIVDGEIVDGEIVAGEIVTGEVFQGAPVAGEQVGETGTWWQSAALPGGESREIVHVAGEVVNEVGNIAASPAPQPDPLAAHDDGDLVIQESVEISLGEPKLAMLDERAASEQDEDRAVDGQLLSEPAEKVDTERCVDVVQGTVAETDEIPIIPASAVVAPAEPPWPPPTIVEPLVVSANSSVESTRTAQDQPWWVSSGVESLADSVESTRARSRWRTSPSVATPSTAFQTSPPATVQATPPAASQPAAQAGRKVARASSPYHTFAMFAAAMMTLMLGVGGAYWLLAPRPDAEAVWAEVQEDYQLRKWTRAEKGFDKFAERFPDSPHVAEIPFFQAMCDAGRDIHSQTGDTQKGLEKIQGIFLKFRDTPEYDKYAADLYMTLIRLIERLVDQAKKTASLPDVDRARQAQELLVTVAAAMKDDWVPERTAEVSSRIDEAGKLVEVARVTHESRQRLEQIASATASGAEIDAQFMAAQRPLQKYPQVAAAADIQELLQRAYASDAGRVNYRLADVGPDITGGADLERRGKELFVVWDQPAQPAAALTNPQIVLALARGVLYAFSDRGDFLWGRRLGIDSYRLPIHVEGSASAPPAVIAVSTIDNSLLAIAATTGRVLWRYQAGHQDLSAPLTISRWRPQPNQDEIVRGLLPTAAGEIHVLELARGKRLGVITTGYPMTVEGVFDPQTQLVFFPADSRRVFAVDPAAIEGQAQAGESRAQAAARAVLFSEHASGSLRSRPLVVNPYLILIEAQDLDRTKIRAFAIDAAKGFLDPKQKPLNEISIPGWSWFTPPTTPDRITVITDTGQLGIFGLNLDNRSEALYRLISATGDGFPSLPVQDPFPALGIQSDEHLLWIMAGGSLRHFALDLLNQKVNPIWPEKTQPAAVTGIPLHLAQMDQFGERLFITTQSPAGDRTVCSAVVADTGELLWQRQLGIHLADDPQPLGDRVLMIDRSGRGIALELAAGQSQAAVRWTEHAPVPERGGSGPLMKIAAVKENQQEAEEYLVLPVADERRLAIRAAGQSSGSGWEVELPEPLQGRPTIVGDTLVVPCADGFLHRRPLAGGPVVPAANDVPYQWATTGELAPDDQARLYALKTGGNGASADEIVLVRRQRAWRLRYRSRGGVSQWEPAGKPFYSAAPILGAPLVSGGDLIFASANNELQQVAGDDLATVRKRWQLDGNITTPPFLLGDQLCVITNRRTLVCLSPDAEGAKVGQPVWTLGPLAGRICGKPVLIGSGLLVTDDSGCVTGLRPTDGQVVFRIPLDPGDIPAAAAVPIGNERILVPLVDGTLVLYPISIKPGT